MTSPAVSVFGATEKVADVLQAARSVADWNLVEATYRQCIDIANDELTKYMPDALSGFMAVALARVSSSYIGREADLAQHALAAFGEVERREDLDQEFFRSLYSDKRFYRLWNYSLEETLKRRRPCPFETVLETCRRLRDANTLKGVLRGRRTSGILGGSVSYGRFYNVCGNKTGEASDLDFAIIIESADVLPEVTARLAELTGSEPDSLTALTERVGIFAERYDNGQTIFSHKIGMWSPGIADSLMTWAEAPAYYRLSLHFLTLGVLDWLLVGNSTRLRRSDAGTMRTVRDYREFSAARQDHQRSFGGRNQRLDMNVEEARGGYLRRSRVYLLDRDDCYYPGMFQNLILPRLDLRWDELEVKGKLDSFKWKVIERLRYERRVRPNEFLRLSLAHTRCEVFAPHVSREIDTGLEES